MIAKLLKKSLLMFLSAVIAIGGALLVGCGRLGNAETIDNARTQLYVGNFNGGYGDTWLRNAKVRFEELYKDQSFEEGKKGVQVWITNYSDRSICGTSLYENISLSK